MSRKKKQKNGSSGTNNYVFPFPFKYMQISMCTHTPIFVVQLSTVQIGTACTVPCHIHNLINSWFRNSGKFAVTVLCRWVIKKLWKAKTLAPGKVTSQETKRPIYFFQAATVTYGYCLLHWASNFKSRMTTVDLPSSGSQQELSGAKHVCQNGS